LAPQLNALRASSLSYSTGQAGNFVAHPGETRCAETKVCFTGRAGGSAAHGWGVRFKSIPGGDCWLPLNGYSGDAVKPCPEAYFNMLQGK